VYPIQLGAGDLSDEVLQILASTLEFKLVENRKDGSVLREVGEFDQGGK
jgi:hypothetical protein